MKSSIITIAVAIASVSAQTPAAPKASASAKGKCRQSKDIKSLPDPLTLISSENAQFPCDMGTAIPFGPVPKGCADLEIIVARGTTEPGDLGVIVGDPLVARVKRDLSGVNVRGYPVQYAASIASALGTTGQTDIKNRIIAQSKECPNEKFALAGYSQGGMVTLSALKDIPAELQSKVVAVITYGAGDGTRVNAAFKSKTLTNCAPGDFACPNSGSGPGHVSYNSVGTKWHDRASEYIVKAFKGTPVGAKLERSPTDPL